MTFERLMIDREKYFTTFPMDTMLQIGATSTSTKVSVDLGNGESVKSQLYLVRLNLGEQTGNTLAVAFASAQPVLGSKFLEDLGFRINRQSGLLEPSRVPPLVAEREK